MRIRLGILPEAIQEKSSLVRWLEKEFAAVGKVEQVYVEGQGRFAYASLPAASVRERAMAEPKSGRIKHGERWVMWSPSARERNAQQPVGMWTASAEKYLESSRREGEEGAREEEKRKGGMLRNLRTLLREYGIAALVLNPAHGRSGGAIVPVESEELARAVAVANRFSAELWMELSRGESELDGQEGVRLRCFQVGDAVSGLQAESLKRVGSSIPGATVVNIVRGRRENGQDFMTALVTGEPDRILEYMQALHKATGTAGGTTYSQMRWLPRPSDTDAVAGALVAVKARKPMGFGNAPGDLWPNATWVWTAVQEQLRGEWPPGREEVPRTPSGAVRFVGSSWMWRSGQRAEEAAASPAPSTEVVRQLFRGELETQIATLSGGTMTSLEELVKGAMDGRAALKAAQMVAQTNAGLTRRVTEVEAWKGQMEQTEQRMGRAAAALEAATLKANSDRAAEVERRAEELRLRKEESQSLEDRIMARLGALLGKGEEEAPPPPGAQPPAATMSAAELTAAQEGSVVAPLLGADEPREEEMPDSVTEEEAARLRAVDQAERVRLRKLIEVREKVLTTAQKEEERAAEGDKEAAGHATRLAREELEKAMTEQVEHERTAIPEPAQKKRTRVPEKRGPGGVGSRKEQAVEADDDVVAA